MVFPKLNKGNKNNFVIALANSLKIVDKTLKVNKFKKDMREEILTFKTLNKTNTKKLQKLVAKEHKELVEQKITEFNQILTERPKRLMTAYMTYSQKQLSKHKDLSFAERGKAISLSWKGLSAKQKQKHAPSKSDKSTYQKQLLIYQDKIKAFKANS